MDWYRIDLRVYGCWDDAGSWGRSISLVSAKYYSYNILVSNWRPTVTGSGWYLSGTTTVFYLNWRGAVNLSNFVFKPNEWLGAHTGSLSCRDAAIGPPGTINKPHSGWYFYCWP